MVHPNPLTQLTSCFKPTSHNRSKGTSKPWSTKDAEEENDDVPDTLEDASEILERPQWKELTPPSPHPTSRPGSALSMRTKRGAKRTVKIPTYALSALNRPVLAANERADVQDTTATGTVRAPYHNNRSQVDLSIQTLNNPEGQTAHPMPSSRSPPSHDHQQLHPSDQTSTQPSDKSSKDTSIQAPTQQDEARLPKQTGRKARSSDVFTIGVPYESHTTGVGPRRAPPSRVSS